MDEQSDEAAKAKINEILTMINAGKITFEEAAKQFSDDKGSAVNGGVLPAFEVSRMVPEFIQAISKLQPDSISSPVKTEYGWHLIKLVNTVKLPAYEEYLPTLKSKVNRDSRSNMSKESAVEKFKSEFKFKEYAKNLSKFYDAVDSSIFKQQWKAENAAAYNAVLFKLDKKSYTQTDFAIYLENHQKPIKSATIRYYIDRIYDQWIEETVMQYKDSKLESQNVDFRMLVNEYHDGILLFAISDEEVWGKAVRDTAGLRDFHAKNAEKYIWGERVEATIYKCVDEAVAKEVSAMLNAGIVLDSIVKKVNSKSALSLHFERGKYEAGNSSAIDQIKKQKGVSPILTIGSSFVIVDVQTILPVQNKTLDEARGLITADYQNYLEKKWLEKLHSTHSITINKELLEKE
jgi:peptidyl-prolyl cis-trans isomerase SurA